MKQLSNGGLELNKKETYAFWKLIDAFQKIYKILYKEKANGYRGES